MLKTQTTDRCYIIAEIGGNFLDLDQAKLLIDLAHECDVDAVKLQTYTARNVASKRAIFDMENTGVVSQYDLFKKYEIDEKLHTSIFEYASEVGLDCFSTPSHESDVDLLERLSASAHKIGSDDATNIPLLKYVSKTNKPIILSTGMCTLEEVGQAVNAVLEEGNSDVSLLHAITSYPTHSTDVNLSAIQTLKQSFPNLNVGYSDHTLDPVACICAVAMGATIIEKHFTFDKNAAGPDHQISADPNEMKWLVKAIRQFEVMRGHGIKMPARSEKTTRVNNRKSIVAAKDLSPGDVITPNSIAIKRPGTGIPPRYHEQILGRKVLVNISHDEVINWEALQ